MSHIQRSFFLSVRLQNASLQLGAAAQKISATQNTRHQTIHFLQQVDSESNPVGRSSVENASIRRSRILVSARVRLRGCGWALGQKKMITRKWSKTKKKKKEMSVSFSFKLSADIIIQGEADMNRMWPVHITPKTHRWTMFTTCYCRARHASWGAGHIRF